VFLPQPLVLDSETRESYVARSEMVMPTMKNKYWLVAVILGLAPAVVSTGLPRGYEAYHWA